MSHPQRPSSFGDNSHGKRGGGRVEGGYGRGGRAERVSWSNSNNSRRDGKNGGATICSNREFHHRNQQRRGDKQQAARNNQRNNMGGRGDNHRLSRMHMPSSSLYGCPPPPSPPPSPEAEKFHGHDFSLMQQGGPQDCRNGSKRLRLDEDSAFSHPSGPKKYNSSRVCRDEKLGGNNNNNSSEKQGLKVITVSVPGCKPQQFQVCVGNHPDDVQAWIKARKERYPTRANIAKKLKEQETRSHLSLSSAMSCLAGNVTNFEEKDTNEKEVKNTKSTTNSPPATALSTLFAGYSSSSSEDDDDDDVIKEKSNEETLRMSSEGTGISKEVEKSTDSVSKPSSEDATDHALLSNSFALEQQNINSLNSTNNLNTISSTNNNPTSTTKDDREGTRSKGTRNNNLNWLKQKQRRKQRGIEVQGTPLLQKLLSRDIDREAVLTLQCLSFIAQNNFLQPKPDSVSYSSKT